MPTQQCYAWAINALGTSEGWVSAVALLREMPLTGVEPDEACYASAVKACERDGKDEQAKALLEEMAVLNLRRGAEAIVTGERFFRYDVPYPVI